MSGGRDVSVIICTYTEERWHYLVDAVESVYFQRIPPLEIIVVVDHNPALAARARANLRGVVVVENQLVNGLSGARNTGIAVAKGTVLAFLDDDAVAFPEWLENLNHAYDVPEVMAAGGLIDVMWMEHQPLWFPEEFLWALGCTYRGSRQTAGPVRNLIGCNMSFRREVFSVIGGFRTGLGRVGSAPAGCEETELCIRVRQQWPQSLILFLPKARVTHRMSASRSRWTYFLTRCYGEGISKAFVSQTVGFADALSAERRHVLRDLPRGVARGVKDAIVYHDRFGLLRAVAIVLGLALTVSGYLVGALMPVRSAEAVGSAMNYRESVSNEPVPPSF